MMKVYPAAIAASVLSVLALSACGGGGSGGGDTQYVTIATGGTGGSYYPIGGAMGNMLADKIKDVDSGTAETTGGSVENIDLLGRDQVTMAMAMNDAVYDAVNGKGDFDKPQDVCTIGIMYPNLLQIGTTEGSGIKTVEDLKGKRVSVGDAGSATELMFRNTTSAVGIKYSDFGDTQRLDFDAQTTAIRNNQLDAGAWVVGAGTSSLQDLASSEDISFATFSDAQTKTITKKYPFYITEELKPGTYDGQDQAVPVIGTWNSLLMNSDTDQKFVGEVTKAVFENVDALKSGSAEIAGMKPSLIKHAIAPVCPGSMDYFKQQGVSIPKDLRPTK